MAKPNGEALGGALIKLSRIVVSDAALDDTLLQVAQLGQQTMPGADACGLTLVHDGRRTTSVSTSDDSFAVDRGQFERSAGPGLQAYREGSVFRVDSTRTDARWPEFCQDAADAGFLSTLSVPLVVGENGTGVMSYYASSESGFAEDDEVLGASLAAAVAVVLANSEAYWAAQTLATQLAEAMQSRAVIEQAKGIVMAQSGVNPDDAFQLLVRASQRENRKLRDIAAELVQRTQRPSAD